MKKSNLFLLCLALTCCILPVGLVAQDALPDTSYYKTYPEHVSGRFYFSRKYTGLALRDEGSGQDYLYMPNTTLNMGVGATYKMLTLNLAYGFGFLNPEKGKGETKYLDAQAHVYPRTMVIDLFLQLYRGYYLTDGLGAPADQPYLLRPDMKIRKVGASVQHVFNHRRFSYRAAFLQNEWQKKSAGTFLLGAEMYGGMAQEDAFLVPSQLMNDPGRNFETIRFFEFGPNAGYAYTLVIREHFFITGSASTNLGLGYAKLRGAFGERTQWGINANYFLRGFVGYNSSRWSVNANYVHNNVGLEKNSGFSNALMTGNYRFNIIYRFLPGPGLKKRLRGVDRVLEAVERWGD